MLESMFACPEDCFHSVNDQLPGIDSLTIDNSERLDYSARIDEILYIQSGTSTIRYNDAVCSLVRPGNLMYLPIGTSVRFDPIETTRLIVLRLGQAGYFDLPMKSDLSTNHNSQQTILTANNPMESFFTSIEHVIGLNVRCMRFAQLKANEFLALLLHTYSKTEVYDFFHPEISEKTRFARMVSDRSRQVDSVKELARRMNCTEAVLCEKFRSVFATAPSRWMKDRKIAQIKMELSSGNKSLDRIADEFGFKSVRQLNDFCRKNLPAPCPRA